MSNEEQIRRQREQLRKTAVAAEVDKVFKVRQAGVQAAPVQDSEDQKTLRRMRLETIKESSHFEVPEYAAKEQLYAKKPKSEFSSARKRQKEINKQGSVLQKRTQNRAEVLSVEAAFASKQQDVDKLFEEAIGAGAQIYDLDREALTGFLSNQNKAADMAQINAYALGGDSRLGVINDCMKEFMKIDITSIPVDSDAQIAKSAGDLVRLREQLHSLDLMIQMNPDYLNRISDEAKELFRVHREEAAKLVEYYDYKMQVITDQYYSEHLNSEIGHRYDPEATPELRSLAMKISMADVAHKRLNPSLGNVATPKMQDVNPKKTEKYCKTVPLLTSEFGKNKAHPHAYRNQDYVGFLEGRDKELAARLCTNPYTVSGETKSSAESFSRHLFCLANLKACQMMPEGTLIVMLDKMRVVPSDPANPAEVSKARQTNLEGMRIFMDMMAKQIKYLERKYGQAFDSMTPQEFQDHKEDLAMDFANFAGFVSFLEYCSTFPELATKADREILKKAKYYDFTVISHTATTAYLTNYHATGDAAKSIDPASRISYTDYKKEAAGHYVAMAKTGELSRTMKDSRKDVDWLATFEEGKASAIELMKYLNDDADFALLVDRYKKTHPKQPIEWHKLMPEIEQMGLGPDETAHELVRLEMEAQKAVMLTTWKQGGVQGGAANLPGIGSDDMDFLCMQYSNMAANHAMMVQFGITNPAAQQEFGQIILDWQAVGQKMRELEYSANAALMIANSYRRGATKNEAAKKIIDPMRAAFNRVADVHSAEYSRIKSTEGDQMHEKLRTFLASHDVFTFTEHKTKYDEIAAEKRAAMKFDQMITLSGFTFTTTKVEERYAEHDLSKFLAGKQLNDGVDPAEFGSLVDEYNEMLSKLLVDSPLRWSITSENDMDTVEDWKKIEHKKGFFMYDIDARFWYEHESLEAMRAKMGTMIH